MRSAMTLPPPVLVGCQTPTLLVRPAWSTAEKVDAALKLGRSCGIVADPWQRLGVELILSERADGLPASDIVGVECQRQNGKGVILILCQLFWLFVEGLDCIHTAHQVPTAKDHQRKMWAWIQASPTLRKRAMLRVSNGDVRIDDAVTGARLAFLARSKSSGRGMSAPRLVFDEAMDCGIAEVDQLSQVLTSFRSNQSVYAGSAGLAESAVWWALRKRAQSGDAGRLGWMEWAADDSDASDDPAVWAKTNPALGGRFSMETARSLFDQPGSPAGFRRERLGVWDPLHADAVRSVIDMAAWQGCKAPGSQPEGGLVWCWDVGPQRVSASIGVAARSSLGGVHWEPVDSRPGAGWVAGRLAELVASHGGVGVVCPPGEAASMAADVTASVKVPVQVAKPGEMASACSELVGLVAAGQLRACARDDLAALLTSAVSGAGLRPAGDGWRWARPDGTVDLAPLSALTAGLAGLRMEWTPAKVFSVG